MGDAPVVCVFGTASDVGKSLVTTALCRLLRDAGWSVAPFKAQNMSNNSGVTADGLEMGRAQFVQAQAAGIAPTVEMNPVLLKPTGERSSQIVVLGKAVGEASAAEYFRGRKQWKGTAMAALSSLRRQHQVVIVEGAGSCAEVNLRSRDFVNFSVAHAADASVLLVADIDRGGVFAQVVGSLEVMLPEDRARVRGVLINRFRGDPALFADGVKYLEDKTGVPVVGVLPYDSDLRIESEDGLDLRPLVDPPFGQNPDAEIRIAVVCLPRISNFTDFEPLSHCPGVAVHFLSQPRGLDDYDLVILPGSKSVVADLAWLRVTGWADLVQRRAVQGRKVLGVCGGFQMLGTSLIDSLGVDGQAGTYEGLSLLRATTQFVQPKVVCRSAAHSQMLQCTVSGYEIHMGITQVAERPLFESVRRVPTEVGGEEGARNAAGSVLGTYLHGLFDTEEALRGFLSWVRPGWSEGIAAGTSFGYQREEQLQALARHFERSVNMPRLWGAMGLPPAPVGPSGGSALR